MKHVLSVFLVSCLWLIVSPTAQAIVDINNNGLSDLWERAHNDGNLFPTNFDPQADPDGDGWTNAQEAAAGTDPSDANPPAGYLQPQITYYSTVYYTDPETNITETQSPATVTLNWPTLPGKQYTLYYSTDLSPENWSMLDEPRIGTGWDMGNAITLTQPDGSIADRIFWRVAVTDPVPAIDTDSDGLGAYEEYLAGTDPSISDSDEDTLSDYAELIAGTNPNNADEDGDGITDPIEIAAGTDSKNQDTDGDAIPDYLDNQPLLSAQAFADADDDGIPDEDDPDPNNPRGPKPLIISDNASGNPNCELELDESSSFILTVSNPAGPAPTASDFTLYLNGTEETANINALTTPPSAPGTQRFNFSWLARVTTSYPTQTLQNISLRFKDAQNATTWLNVARADVAEWEGMIAGVSSDGLNFPDYPQVRVASHYKGVKQSTERFLHGGSVWYRGPKAITLLDASGSNTGSTAQIGAERYPLFVISKSGSTYNVEQTLDISDPVAYPHYGRFYVNRWSTDITMSPSAVGSIGIPAGAIRFQAFPPAPETGTPNFGVIGHSFIDGENKTIYTNVWTLTEQNLPFRQFRGLVFFNGTTSDGESYQDNDGIGGVNADIGATIIPHSAGTLEYPGMPISSPGFPPAPYNNWPSQTPLLPLQSEQWHKLVLKVGPDAGAISNGITLKLGKGVEGENDPQTGFTLQTPGTGGFEPLAIPANGKIEMAPTSELYQKLTSLEGLTLFLKRDSTVNQFHRLGLDLIPKRSTYLIQRVAALDLPPLDLVPDINMAGVIGDVVESAVVGSNIKHFVTPRVTTELPATHVILKATGITAEQIDDKSPKQIFEWIGGEKIEGEPLKIKVSRHDAAPHVIQIKVKQGGAVAAQINVWVVWVSGIPDINPMGISETSISTKITGDIEFDWTIHPATLTSDAEIPDLKGVNVTLPPNPLKDHIATDLPLLGGVNHKWDTSRQVRVKILNLNLYSKAQLPHVPGKLYDNQPVTPYFPDVPEDYPAGPVLEGNDDSKTDDESNNAYVAGKLGKLHSFDNPSLGFSGSTGTIDGVFEERAHFKDFVRLEIVGKWYRVADPIEWQMQVKLKKEMIDGTPLWKNKDSKVILGNADF